VKCPKCQYIGFETGERCKNCGYDFSLVEEKSLDLALRDGPEIQAAVALDLALRAPAESEPVGVAPVPVVTVAAVADVVLDPPAVFEIATPALPLFLEESTPDDEPLIRMAAPRMPIAVRKTPEAQRIRLQSLPSRVSPTDGVLEFVAETPGPVESGTRVMDAAEVSSGRTGRRVPPVEPPASGTAVDRADVSSVTLLSRIGAAAIDYGLLFALDATVIYFTLRLTALGWSDWRLVPAVPLLAFLFGLKLTYLSTFTLAGGQTIGKMAVGIRVVGDGVSRVDAAQSVRRAVVEMASVVALGLPFLVAFADPARRGLHDRVAGTRVVTAS
jgi:uncharacterized RDD family membrane protein YckC